MTATSEQLIVSNLPLRRRCLFLTDMIFLTHCFESDAADALLGSLHTAVLTHQERLRVAALEAKDDEEEESSQAVETAMQRLAALTCSTDGNNAPSSPPSRCIAVSPHARLSWAEQLEVLLTFLETSDSPEGKAKRDVVRSLCVALIGALYETGTAYYTQKELEEEKAEQRKQRKRPRDKNEDNADVLVEVAAPRVTWSVAQPVHEVVYSMFV